MAEALSLVEGHGMGRGLPNATRASSRAHFKTCTALRQTRHIFVNRNRSRHRFSGDVLDFFNDKLDFENKLSSVAAHVCTQQHHMFSLIN